MRAKLQVNYYAYGLKIAAISSRKLGDVSEGQLKNQYLYNDKELWDDGDLNWYDYGFRNYDPQIGRFTQLDPLTWEYPELTPYQYASCDPIANIDLDGLEGFNSIKTLENVTVTSTKSASNIGRTLTFTYTIITGTTTLYTYTNDRNTGTFTSPVKLSADYLSRPHFGECYNYSGTIEETTTETVYKEVDRLREFNPNEEAMIKYLTNPDNIGGNMAASVYSSVQGAKQSFRNGEYLMGTVHSFNAMVNTAAITGGGAGGTLNGNLNPNRNTNLALFEAARGTGMFGIKSLSYDEAMNAGKKWMGDNKFRLMSTGTGWLSGDKLRQFRFPLYKRSYNQIQSNFEWRFQPKGSWPNNGHSIINP